MPREALRPAGSSRVLEAAVGQLVAHELTLAPAKGRRNPYRRGEPPDRLVASRPAMQPTITLPARW
jgi:hypothetical protein